MTSSSPFGFSYSNSRAARARAQTSAQSSMRSPLRCDEQRDDVGRASPEALREPALGEATERSERVLGGAGAIVDGGGRGNVLGECATRRRRLGTRAREAHADGEEEDHHGEERMSERQAEARVQQSAKGFDGGENPSIGDANHESGSRNIATESRWPLPHFPGIDRPAFVKRSSLAAA